MTRLGESPRACSLAMSGAAGAAILIVVLLAVPIFAPAQTTDIFNNTNVDAVANGPTAPTVFTLHSGATVTQLVTYHWNNAHGAVPGKIGLRSGTGAVYGPFDATPSSGQGGAPNVNWTATVNLPLTPGDYTVVDTEPATWSQNARSGNRGFAIVRGALQPTQPSDDQAPGRGFEYAVKFVCGKPEVPVVAPGDYFTAINVHNPNNRVVNFRKKIAVALPGEKGGPISKFYEATLKPDQALEIDCPDILRHAEAQSFLKGFVVIETPWELDVVAVYTAGHPQVETMEVEHVKPRTIQAAQTVTSGSDSCPGNPVNGVGCCCNEPKPGPPGTMFPDCRAPLVCVRDPNANYSVCATHVSVNTFLDPTPAIAAGQPARCAQP